MKERHDLLSCPGISTHRPTELTDRRAKESTAAAFFLSESVQEDAQHFHWEEQSSEVTERQLNKIHTFHLKSELWYIKSRSVRVYRSLNT